MHRCPWFVFARARKVNRVIVVCMQVPDGLQVPPVLFDLEKDLGESTPLSQDSDEYKQARICFF